MVAGLSAESRAAPEAFPGDLRSAVLQSWFRLSSETPATCHGARGRWPADARRRARGGRGRGSRPGSESQLQEAVGSGTLVAVGDGAFWFHYPLNAEVLEADLVEDDRRDLHARFADTIERRSARRGRNRLCLSRRRCRCRRRPPRCREADAPGLRTGPDRRGPHGRRESARRATATAASCHCASRRAARRRRESIDTLLRRQRTVAADAGASADELDAVESLLARVDRESHPLVTAELLVRRMHLRDITGQGFIDVAEMRAAVRLAEADTTSPEYALALAELAARRGVGRSSRCAGARESAAIAVARGTDDLRALSHALAAGSMTAGVAGDAPTARALAHEAVEAAPGRGRLVGVRARDDVGSGRTQDVDDAAYSLLIQQSARRDGRSGRSAGVCRLDVCRRGPELAHPRRLAGMRRASPCRPRLRPGTSR